MRLYEPQKKIVSIPDGRIHVLKSGCIHILERCLPSGNPIHAVIVLQRNLRRLQDRNIRRKTEIFIENLCSMGMKKRLFG